MVLGIHPKRNPPKFVRRTFSKWFRQRKPGNLQAADTVILLNDTYMNHNYPEIGKSAVALLEAAGLKVVLSETVCCGRPMISKGMLDNATANAVSNVEQLYSHAEAGVPVIGCEPDRKSTRLNYRHW